MASVNLLNRAPEQSAGISCDNSENCNDGYPGNNAQPILIETDSDDETENMSACLTPSLSGSVVSREATVDTSSLVCSDNSVAGSSVGDEVGAVTRTHTNVVPGKDSNSNFTMSSEYSTLNDIGW